MAVNQKLCEIVADTEEKRRALLESVRDWSQAQLDFRAQPDAWSAGEILHHLHLIEASITKLLAKQTIKAQQQNIGSDTSDGSWLNSLDHMPIESRERKMKAPPYVAPQQGGLMKEELLALLRGSRAEFLATIERASDYDLAQLTFPHPFLGDLNLYQWILFVGKHEARHTTQIVEVKACTDFPMSNDVALA
jgi:uncharacterized damage-inducible protein DinB